MSRIVVLPNLFLDWETGRIDSLNLLARMIALRHGQAISRWRFLGPLRRKNPAIFDISPVPLVQHWAFSRFADNLRVFSPETCPVQEPCST